MFAIFFASKMPDIDGLRPVTSESSNGQESESSDEVISTISYSCMSLFCNTYFQLINGGHPTSLALQLFWVTSNCMYF